MKQVNPYYLSKILYPFAGMADFDEEVIKYRSLDPNNETEVKKVIEEILKPYFLGFDHNSQEKIKLTLSFYLTKSSVNFGGIFDSLLPPFESPDNPVDFFIWVWEVFFPNEDYHLDDLDEYTESKDMYAPMRLKHISDEKPKEF